MTPALFGLTMFAGTLITGFAMIAALEYIYRRMTRSEK